MRSGANCTVQQTLTTEAASVLKHSLSLARRRGHAQVTPLHVAATLLSLRISLLKRACLKSQPQVGTNSPHQYPLQCRALELCFNVALNRLPTTPGPLLHGQPSLSNALVAALKRAQAHQRRGCIEQHQQQPLLTVKVELEQLIISILDDPSVSRVMREAGFSSTVVKNNIADSSASSVFQCYSASGGVFSSPCSPSHPETHREIFSTPTTFWPTHLFPNPVLFSPQNKVPATYLADSTSVKEDIKLVLEVFLGKKRKNTVIVGDCVSITEGLVGELIGRVERGEVPMELKQTQFIKFQIAPVSLRVMRKEEVEMNVSELRRKVDSFKESGAIICTGDLKWTVEESSKANGGASSDGYYSPVDHLVTEIGKLLSDYGNSNSRVWLMATASYQTYMRCQMRQPPLEVQWALQAVSVPSGGLGLSLQASSNHDVRITFSQNPSQALESKPFIVSYIKQEQEKITCCPECTASYEKEAQLFESDQKKHLPAWLQPEGSNTNQKDELAELKRKWDKLCLSLNHQARHSSGHGHLVSTLYTNHNLRGKSNSQASSYQWWPTTTQTQSSFFPGSNSISFAEPIAKPISNGVPKFRRQNSCTIDFNFSNGNQKPQPRKPSLDSLKKYTEGKEVKISLSLGSSFVSESGKLEKGTGDFCRLLKENVPWQSAVIPSIVEALTESKFAKKETWLLIQGNDIIGKRRLALALAELVLGSPDSLLHLNMKRRDNEVTTCTERLVGALRSKEGLVVLVEDVDLAETGFLKFLGDQFEAGRFAESSQREGTSGQVIFILTKSESTSYDDGGRNHGSVIQMTLKVNEEAKSVSNGSSGIDHKRKAERDIASKSKAPRLGEREDETEVVPSENGSSERDFPRQSSFNTLDLNVKAGEDDESEDKPGELSPISSDLTRETSSDPLTPYAFLDPIKNRFVFHRTEAQETEMKDSFEEHVKRGFEEVLGDRSVAGFRIDHRVVEGVVDGFGSFVNSQVGKWLKQVFQTSLQTVKLRGKGRGIDVKLCYGGKSDRVMEDGFMGTYLPNKIQVSFMD